jgi:hypothetical protein
MRKLIQSLFMSTYDLEESYGRITVKFHTEIITRLLGLPFLLGSAYILYSFVLGLVKFTQAGKFFSFFAPSHIPGLLMGLCLAAMFGAPGVFLALLRRRVTIDASKSQIEEVVDYFVYQRRRLYTTTDFDEVLASVEKSYTKGGGGRSSGHASRLLAVKLIPKDANGRQVLVGLPDTVEQTIELGGKVARLLNVKFTNLLTSES